MPARAVLSTSESSLPRTALDRQPTATAVRRFYGWGISTLVLVYLLILAGSVVRSTGSGMGCPDWPRCFGQWIPPTDVSQLPADYATRFAIPGHVPEFNALKTWVEYVNRLLGVLVGFAVLGTAVTALPYWRADRVRVVAAFAAFVLVGFNGWLGSRVVATVLSPTLITVHMMAALAVVAALIVALARRDQSSEVLHERSPMLLTMAAFALAIVLVQVVLGTEVRGEVDAAAARLGEAARATWLNTLGGELLVHRALPAALLLVYVALGMRLHQEKVWFELGQTFYACLSLAMGNAALGFLLVALGMPAWAQPLHLLGGTLLVGAHVLLLLQCLSLSTFSQANIVNHARHA